MFWAELVLTGKKQELTGNRKNNPGKEKHQGKKKPNWERKTGGKEKQQTGKETHHTPIFDTDESYINHYNIRLLLILDINYPLYINHLLQ